MIPPVSSLGELVPSGSVMNLCLDAGGELQPEISLGVFAAVPPTNVCSAPPTIPVVTVQ